MTERDTLARLVVPVNENDHVQGPADAPVTLVEYGDYECPFCGRAYGIVKRLQAELGDRVRFVFRNFPLVESHPHAEEAAEAAEVAAQQGKFWDMHDYLYEHQGALDERHLAEYARILSLDAVGFERELDGHAEHSRIEDDLESGLESGVMGTPTFFINGVRYDGSYDIDSMREALLAAEQASRR
ncbi:MAG TPA: DsbA family protein [Chloroflexota bacterium]